MADAPSGSEFIVPFYSERTLREVHSHIKDLHDGLAVYISQDRSFATIGTRGTRPQDGSPGLIIHLSVDLSDDSDEPRRVNFDSPYHNLEYAVATGDELKILLIGALTDSGAIAPGSRPDDDRWRYF
ncbi:MAG: hypothetical protein ACRYGO_03385 [Janthinobacterium lividum]